MERGWKRLADQIRADAAGRYDTLRQLARAAGLSTRVVEDLTAGRRTRYRERTLAGVESALEWEPGSARRVVEGGKPRRLQDPDLARVVNAWPRLSERDRRVLLALLDALSRP